MTKLTKLALENVVSFKQADVGIEDNDGFVVIQGINHDSNIADNSNGAGKSLLFGTLPVALYEADPLALSKKNKKDIHTARGSHVIIEFVSNSGKNIRVEQHGSKYLFFVDGVDQRVQTQDIARSKLQEHWPLREEEFYTTCYINSQRQCDFQKTKPSQRLDFVTNLFNLEIYDRLRQYFAKKRSEIKDREIEFGTLATQLETVDRDIAKTKWSKTSNEKLANVRRESKALQKQIEEIYDSNSSLETLLDNSVTISDLAHGFFADTVELFAHETDLRLFAKQLNLQLDYLDERDEYNALKNKFEQRKRNLVAEKRKLDTELKSIRLPQRERANIDGSIASVEKRLDKCKEKARDLYRSIEDEQDRIETVDAIIGKINELGYDSIAAVDMETDVDEEIAMAKALISLVNDLDGHKNCPTCQQPVNLKLITKKARRAESEVEELVDLRKAQRLVKEYHENSKSTVDYSALQGEADENDALIKRYKSRYDKLMDYRDIVRERETVVEKLNDLVKPKRPRGRIYYKSIPDNELVEYLDRIEKVSRAENKIYALLDSTKFNSAKRRTLVKQFKSGNEKAFDKTIRGLTASYAKSKKANAAQLRELKEQANEANEIAVRLETAKSNWRLLQDQRLELSGKIEKVRPLIEKKKVIETLYQAYGNTNLKLAAATKILKLVEDNLNRYSPLVFPETMKFSLDAGTRGIDANVMRKDGLTSDISKLSGAETNCFRLLFAISILPLIPAERRTNFMILDEPDSACSDAVRNHLCTEFIPKLRAVVPHIFWITPKDADIFKEADRWLVEKRDGVSSISGQKHEIA